MLILISRPSKERTSDARYGPPAEPLGKTESASVMDMGSSETHQPQSKPGDDVFAGVNALVGCEGAPPPNKDDIISPRGFEA